MDDHNTISALLRSLDDDRAPAGDCTESNRLAAYVDGGLNGEDLIRFETHLAGCKQCLTTVGVLLRVSGGDVLDSPQPTWLERARQFGASPPAARKAPWRWAAAAVVLVGLGSALLWLQSLEQIGNGGELSGHGGSTLESRVVRGPESTVTGPGIEHPSAGAVVASDELEIRWTEIPQARYYSVAIVTESGDQVWLQQSKGLSISVPTTVSLLPGRTYYVQVQANLLEARTLKSPHVEFKVID